MSRPYLSIDNKLSAKGGCSISLLQKKLGVQYVRDRQTTDDDNGRSIRRQLQPYPKQQEAR